VKKRILSRLIPQRKLALDQINLEFREIMQLIQIKLKIVSNKIKVQAMHPLLIKQHRVPQCIQIVLGHHKKECNQELHPLLRHVDIGLEQVPLQDWLLLETLASLAQL